MLKNSNFIIDNNKNYHTFINTNLKFDTLFHNSKKVNSLKNFDTALIAYYMMGLGDF